MFFTFLSTDNERGRGKTSKTDKSLMEKIWINEKMNVMENLAYD